MGESEQVAWQQEKPILEYEVVKKAVSNFMRVMQDDTRISISYDKRTEELIYSNGEEILPIRLLSSGFRSLLGMVFDIAYRMAVLNPDLTGDITEKTPGIVLIDEIDMHLHPEWQWKVVDALKHTFWDFQYPILDPSKDDIDKFLKLNLVTGEYEAIANNRRALTTIEHTGMNRDNLVKARRKIIIRFLKDYKAHHDCGNGDVFCDEWKILKEDMDYPTLYEELIGSVKI